MDQAKTAILSTLAYSDFFNYPLTKAELWRYLIAKKPISFITFSKTLTAIPEVKEIDKLFYLKGRRKNILERQKRKKISEKKLQKAKELITLLSKIPSVELIGISGSLAMYNAEKDADIDLFLITKPQTLWTTRLAVLTILEIFHLRRKRNATQTKDTLCLNMMIDSSHLAFPKNRQDIYTAHEILQMKPLFVRGYIYHEFLRRNKWIATMLPNGFPQVILKDIPKEIPRKSSLAKYVEPIAKFGQILYSKRHATTETITSSFVAFHPNDYKEIVLENWKKKKEKYGIFV